MHQNHWMAMRYRIASRVILRPSRQPIDPGSQRLLHIKSSLGEIDLYERVIQVEGDDRPPLEVWKLHGSSGRAEYASDYPSNLMNRSMRILTWNAPGYGSSQGRADLRNFATILLEVFDAVRGQSRKEPSVFVCGTSLGGALALYLAKTRTVSGLALYNPPPLRQLLPRFDRWWNLWLASKILAPGIPSELDAVESAKACKIPAVFIQSEQDQVVPPIYQHLIIDAYAGPHKVVSLPDADHNTRFGPQHAVALKSAWHFLTHVAAADS